MNPTQEQLRLQMEMEAEAQEQERQQQAVKEPTPTERANMPGYTGPTIGPYTGPVKTFKSPEDLQRETEESGVLPNLALQAQKFGRGLAGGVTAGLATKLAPALQGDWESLTPEQQEQVLKEYRGEGGGLSSVGRAVGAMRTPLNQVGAALGTAGTALNQAAQAGFAGAMENRGLGETLVQSLVAGGLPVLGRALGSFLGPKMQTQQVLPQVNPELPKQQIDELTAKAYREIAAMQGMPTDIVADNLARRPEEVLQTVIEFNRGRSSGIFGPGMQNISPNRVADRLVENRNLAESAMNEAREAFPTQIPMGPVKQSLETARDSLVRTGASEEAVRINALLEQLREARAMDPNAAKVAAMAKARNPMQSMPEAPPPAARAGNVGGMSIDSAFINESSDLNPVSGPLFGYFDDLGRPMQNQDIPGLPKLPNNIRSPISSPVQSLDVAPSGLIEEPVQLSRSAIPVKPSDLPVEGRIGVNPELVEPGFGTSPNVSVPVSDPTTMGRIRAAQAESKDTFLPRDTMRGGGGLGPEQGVLDIPRKELRIGQEESRIGGSRVEVPYQHSANAVMDALEQVSGREARVGWEDAMRRMKAAEVAQYSGENVAARGLTEPKTAPSLKWTAAKTLTSPIENRWRLFQQNRTAEKLLARTPADPRIAQMVEWIRSASPGPAQAARFYVAAQKEPRLLEEIQNEGKEGE